MRQVLAFAGLAIIPLAEAGIGRLRLRDPSDGCCACPPSGQSTLPATVTVTQTPLAPETVTVTQSAQTERTVVVEHTVTQSASTVYVTQSVPQQSAPETVTVSAEPTDSNTATVITETLASSQVEVGPSVVTVTQQPQQYVVTKTIAESSQMASSSSVQTSPVSGVVTVTSAPSTAQSTATYQTVTQTVTQSPDNIFIQIIIINLISGEVSCRMQHNGMPCPNFTLTQRPTSVPLSTVCSTQSTSTSVVTSYNTVTLPASAAMSMSYGNSTGLGVASATGATNMTMARKPRSPMSRLW